VFWEETRAWSVTAAEDVTIDALEPILSAEASLLVVGCGERFRPPPKGLRAALKERGLALEWMDTGAACRTFNVLLAEERGAVAALIAIE